MQANGHTVIVLRLEERGEEPVFNLEVDADHCYRVGEQGILVHNASFITKDCDPCEDAIAKPDKPFSILGRDGKSTFTGKIKAFEGRGEQPKACRVLSIKGPLTYFADRDEDKGKIAQDYMRDLIFGKADADRTQQQKTLGPQYQAGHLIADSLGGPNRTENMVPFVEDLNNKGGAWAAMEQYIRDCLKSGCGTSAVMEVTTGYSDKAPGIRKYIPQTISVTVTFTNPMGTTTRMHTFRNSKSAGRPDWVRFNKPCVE